MSVADYLSGFVTPHPAFSPAPLWWWSGEKLDSSRLCRQMDRLVEMGVWQVIVINLAPSGTLFGCDADDPAFLSEAWWDIFGRVCDHAKSIGMKIRFYDQIGFSGASFQADIAANFPEFLAQQIRCVKADGVGTLTVECSATGAPLAAYLFPLDSPTEVQLVPLTGWTATADVAAPSRLSLVYVVRQGYDFFSATACDRLLDTVHREFERRLPQHLGTTIVGSFQDELPDLPTWSDRFGETFAAKYGYCLEPVIHRLFEPGGAEHRRTRVHYQSHRAELAEEAFFKPFFRWHEERGLNCGFDQQSPAREARIIGCVSKYADYTRTQRWYGIPGSDHYGNGKLHSSLGFMYDRKRVWIEGFHSTGWGGTLADTFDWLLPYLQSGANFYNPHAVYYSTRKGWWEWAPPSTCWRQPYAMHYRGFADMMARLTALLSQGIQQASIAVLFPTTTVQSAVGPQEHFADADACDRVLHETIGSMRWHQAKPGPLEQMGIDYLLIDEPSLADGRIEQGKLKFRGVSFQLIILPRITMLYDATWECLAQFAGTGGKIIAINADQIETTSGKQYRLSSIPGLIAIETPAELQTVLANWRGEIQSALPTLHRRDGKFNILFIPAIAGMATVVSWPTWSAPMEQTTIIPWSYQRTVELTLPSTATRVLQFDPRDGSSRAISTAVHKSHRSLQLHFEGSPFALLAWSENDEHETADSAGARKSSAEELLTLSDAWFCEFVPTLPTDDPDIYDPSQPWLRWPHTTDFRWHWGKGDPKWVGGMPTTLKTEVVRATFGVRAWSYEDRAADLSPVVYSTSFGIRQDSIHRDTLGPKGHVPEEFIDLGKLKADESRILRFGVASEIERHAVFGIGGNALKATRINGEPVSMGATGYFQSTPIRLVVGRNLFECTMTAERDGHVRLFWCLLDSTSANTARRPERMLSSTTASPGSKLVYCKNFETDRDYDHFTIKLSTAAVTTINLDNRLLGQQGGFDPYRLQMHGQRYDASPLCAGTHELKLEVVDPGKGGAVLVDALATSCDGANVQIVSDATWTVSRNGGEERPVQLLLKHDGSPAPWHLFHRPHPLPEANWLEESIPATEQPMLRLKLTPPCEQPQRQWFEWIIPPGATFMRLPLVDVDEVRLWIDGRETPLGAEFGVEFIDIPSRARRAVICLSSRQLGGGIFASAVSYRFGEGVCTIGSWDRLGLRSYSGALRMSQIVHVPQKEYRRFSLDLGHVRGTVECRVNGREAGVRWMAPYRFELTGTVVLGENQIELLVTNTLANHLSTWSPTQSWSPDQLQNGIFGPVLLLSREEIPE